MFKHVIIPFLSLTLLPATALGGDGSEGRAAGAFSGGTTGVTLEVKAKLRSTLVARSGVSWLNFELNGEELDGITYDSQIDINTLSMAADYHPFKNPWMMSVGLYMGKRELSLNSRITDNVVIGGQTFTPGEVGEIVGVAAMDDIATFIGLGWDNTFYTQKKWSYFVRGGITVSGSPNIELTSVGGTLSNNPALISELEAEEASVQEDIDEYKFYPILEAGASYRF
ncbi:MAG: hypothetical protein MRY72_10115 [Aquisalinus sp.]|nr:hypothetical protein [Aquisalinus sp.]